MVRLFVAALIVAPLWLTGAAGAGAEGSEAAAPAPGHLSRPDAPPGRIGASLNSVLDSDESVPVIILLSNDPLGDIAEEEAALVEQELRARREQVRAIHRKYATGVHALGPGEVSAPAASELSRYSAADRAILARAAQGTKQLKDRMRARMSRRMRDAVAPDQAEVESLVRALGGSVTYRYFVDSAVAARLPGRSLAALAAHPLVRRVVEDRLTAACLDVSAPSLGAPSFWAAGENGGFWYNATLDTGVDTGHPNLGKPGGWWQVVRHATAMQDASYRDDAGTPDDLHGHGTHVAGIMNSDHEVWRGVAFGSRRSTNLKAGWLHSDGTARMYHSDAMAAVEWGIANAVIDVLNLSYAETAPAVEGDDDYSRFWDGVVSAWGIVFTCAAGNLGAAGLPSPAINYNGITVANLDDQGTVSRNDDIISPTSSLGPTPPPGRRKPDLAAPGTLITAPWQAWEHSSDFIESSGTSAAAAHVAGAATLLHDAGVDDPRAVKALLIDTADQPPGHSNWWHYDSGHGSVNLNKAFARRDCWFIGSLQPTGHLVSSRLYRVPDLGLTTMTRATMVWNRRVHWNGASYPTSYYDPARLDIYAYSESGGEELGWSKQWQDNNAVVFFPGWKGPVVLRAEAGSSSFPGGASSVTYALAAPPGTVEATGPALTITPVLSTTSPPLNAKFRLSLTVSNAGDLNVPDCHVRTYLMSPGLELVSGQQDIQAGSVPPGGQVTVELWLKATTPGVKLIDVECTSWAFRQEWGDQKSLSVEPGPADSVPPVTVMKIPSVGYRSGGSELMANGGFESGLAVWGTSGAVDAEFGTAATGLRCARLGPGAASLFQSVHVNAAAARAFLSFSYRAQAGVFTPAGCRICDSDGRVLIEPHNLAMNVGQWSTVTFDISRFKGQTIQIRFFSTGNILRSSTLWVDDVAVREGETVWMASADEPLTLITSDDAAGIDRTLFRLQGGAWRTYEAPFTLPVEGANTVSYYSIDNSANTEPVAQTTVHRDTRAPVSVLSVGSPRVIAGGWERLVPSPGFESGLAGWETSGSVTTTSAMVHSGATAARVGGSGPGNLWRDVAIAPEARNAFASFWVRAAGASNPLGAFSAAIVDPETGNVVDYGLQGSTLVMLDWAHVVWDVGRFRGRTVRLEFCAGALSGQVPTLYVDDVSVREDCVVSILPGTELSIRSFDHVGVEVRERSVDGAAYQEGDLFTLSAPGVRSVLYRARDRNGHQEAGIATDLFVDAYGPLGWVRINGGADYTTSRLVVLTLGAVDGSGVTGMRIRNSGEAFGAWEAFAASRSWTLPEGGGTKTVLVQFRDGLGNISAEVSDSIEYVPPAYPRIGDVKLLGPHPVAVVLRDKTVSGVFPAKKMFYIQETDRSSGIKVDTGALSPSLSAGQTGTFEGVIQLDANREPELYLTAFSAGSAGPAPVPVQLMNRELGGGAWGSYIPGVTGGRGLHNTGLLVRTWGKVVSRSLSPPRIWIDDGSAPPGGIQVDLAQAGTVPATGAIVLVTGNLGCVLSGSEIRPELRPRSASDVSTVW